MKKLKPSTKKVIDCDEWDAYVLKVYKKPFYCFQQQDGCRSRGTYTFSVPSTVYEEDDTVTFKEWVKASKEDFSFERDFLEESFWERDFYPCIEAIANDLHNRKLLDEGTYTIIIDW